MKCFPAALSLARAPLRVPVSNRVLGIPEPNAKLFRWDEIIRILSREKEMKNKRSGWERD